MPLTQHVTGQKKTVKIQRSLEISAASAQNIAHKMEVPVRFEPVWGGSAAGNISVSISENLRHD